MFAGARFAAGLPIVLVALVIVVSITFAISRKLGRNSVIDVMWGPAFVVVAVVSFAWSSGHGGTSQRTLLLAMPAIWGLRLGSYIGWRQRGEGEDPRYTAMLDKAQAKSSSSREVIAFRKIYLTQAVAVLFVSLPLQIGMYATGKLSVVAVIGIVIWATGVIFETIGDYQLFVFKKDKSNKGKIMDQGLWRYTRHPNYFGDACVWWGMFLVAASHWPGVLTILSPIAMNFFLTRGTGKKTLEGHMGDRPGFKEYVEATSGFFPLPPKKTA